MAILALEPSNFRRTLSAILFVTLVVFLPSCSPVARVTPAFLWRAVNISLTENRVPWYCPKLVFYTNDTTITSSSMDPANLFGNPDHGLEYAGIVPNIFINVNFQTTKDGKWNWNEWLAAEEQLHMAALKEIHERLDPCVIVLSFVFHTSPYQTPNDDDELIRSKWSQDQDQQDDRHHTIMSSSSNNDDRRSEMHSVLNNRIPTTTGNTAGTWTWNYPDTNSFKYKLRHQMTDLFQYSTPVKSRYLSLVRLTRDLSELRVCTSTKYPLRLVPLWERILFDFFNEAHVIQGLYFDNKSPYVKVGKEYGKYKWLCEDIVERLELERKCHMDHSCLIDAKPEYYKKLWTPGGRPKLRGDLNYCKIGYKARH